ncbi:hypothetical protein RJ639_024538 [Escallonia herrerae]|uniref:Uncharacterized protein n=1 Tax=Escallonia herrerae TaxID=1293975 RepID=A0AA88V168_9ASTE|nr:hypothetical protein RJ639_024538 [Escallonia herrerae]
MASDSELVGRLREFLSTSDLNTTTTAIVRRRLEEEFQIDLSDKKAFIREQVDLYLESQLDKAAAEEEEEVDVDIDGACSDGDDRVKAKSEGEEEQAEEEEEEEEEEEGTSNGRSASKRGSRKKNETVKKRGGGFTKLCSLSPQLQRFTGTHELARTEVVKQLWSYIRENNLQDPNNRRDILCDETLRDLFSVDSINMFQMNKALAKHIWPLGSDGGIFLLLHFGYFLPKATSVHRSNTAFQILTCQMSVAHFCALIMLILNPDSDVPKRKEKRQKGGNSGFLAPLPLSDALVKFLGTGESALARSAVVKRIWDYIKQNDLQDPSDKRRIICDQKLKELFDVDSFNGFTVSKLLKTHFVKTE